MKSSSTIAEMTKSSGWLSILQEIGPPINCDDEVYTPADDAVMQLHHRCPDHDVYACYTLCPLP